MVEPWGPTGAQWWPLGVPWGPQAPQSQILVTFWGPFGSPRGALLGSFWPKVSKSEGLCRLFGALFPVFETGAKRGLPRGGGHAICSRRRMFREGRPSSRRLHFGLHFRSILGGQVGTILLLGQPGMQTTCPEARLNFDYVSKQLSRRMSHG